VCPACSQTTLAYKSAKPVKKKTSNKFPVSMAFPAFSLKLTAQLLACKIMTDFSDANVTMYQPQKLVHWGLFFKTYYSLL
jgi:hypothetical protein